MLLEAGAEANDGGEGDDLTPLMGACSKGYVEIARLLLAAGADPKAVTRDGLTAMKVAVTLGKKEVVEFLRRLGIRE